MNDNNLIDKIIDSQDIKTVQFNFRNDTLTEQEFTLFNLTSLVPLSNIYINGGSVDYNFFVQTLNNDPKLLYGILIKMPQRYLANPVNVIYTDANGQSTTTPYLPNTDIDAFQKSPNRGIIKFEDGLVINVNTQVQIIIPPLTTVILLIDYKEFLRVICLI